MKWSPSEKDYELPWKALKELGKIKIDCGITTFNFCAWENATSAHLAVILVWWRYALERNHEIKITGLNQTFVTLAKLGGVEFLITGAKDVGH